MGKPKGIGFNRIIKGRWLDQAATYAALGLPDSEVRIQLDDFLSAELTAAESRDRTLDLLTRTWLKTAESSPGLRNEALRLFQNADTSSDRIWLHWGMLLLAYPFFHDAVEAIGKSTRFGAPFDRATLAKRLTEQKGEIASLYVGVGRIISLLKDWHMIEPNGAKAIYRPIEPGISTANQRIELWLLASGMAANPAGALPLPDFTSLPEFFPFHFTLTAAEIRRSSWFETYRQGGGLDMVNLTPTLMRHAVKQVVEGPQCRGGD